MQTIRQFKLIKSQREAFILRFLRRHEADSHVVCLHSNDYNADPWHHYDVLLCCGTSKTFSYQSDFSWLELTQFLKQNKGSWIFGHLAYEALRLNEQVNTDLPEFVPVPLLEFFVPEIVLSIKGETMILEQQTIDYDISALFEMQDEIPKKNQSAIRPQKISSMEREDYLRHIQALQAQIHLGTFYEINYCHSMRMEGMQVNPFEIWLDLNAHSQAPFSAYYRNHSFSLCCASPERFVARRDNKIICQPIKGTNRRLADNEANIQQMQFLSQSEKERAENIMIVDLMRNDLGRICKSGTIVVEELCEVYPFAHVNQMISTISGNINADTCLTDVMQALFPPGSMTGAPKVSAMDWITLTETHRRGLYSGTLGYIDPQGDFDFNVVIRSIQMDTSLEIASVSAGGAITSLSDPTAEYEESLLKMESLLKYFNLT